MLDNQLSLIYKVVYFIISSIKLTPNACSNFDYKSFSIGGLPLQERMQFLFMCGMSDRVEALALKVWRNHVTNMIHTANFEWSSRDGTT
jgi:hypothetical protein